MADLQLKNPLTGDIYDVPEEEAENAKRLNGWVEADPAEVQDLWNKQLQTEQDVGSTKKAGFLGSFETAAELSGAAALSLAAKGAAYAGGATEEEVKDFLGPEKMFPGSFTPYRQEIARGFREEHPFVAGVAEAVPQIVTGVAAGALTGGAGAIPTLATTFGVMAAESIPSGFTQENLDSVLEKRDFSVGSAVQNSLVDLALGGVAFGVGKGLKYGAKKVLPTNWLARIEGKGAGAGLKGVEQEAADAGQAGAAAERRGLKGVGVAEEGLEEELEGGVAGLDQTIPPAAAQRELRSAGAAAKKSLDSSGATVKEIMSDMPEGKFDKGVRLIDGQKDTLRDLAALEIKQDLELVSEEGLDAIRKQKNKNFSIGAEKWGKGELKAQEVGIKSIIQDGSKELSEALAEAGPKRGIGAWTERLIGTGKKSPGLIPRYLQAISEASGAARNELIDDYKRGLDRFIGDVGNSRTLETPNAQFLIDTVLEHADQVRHFLEDDSAFGRNAVLQKAINEPWHRLIEPFNAMRRQLMEIESREFAVAGAAGVNRAAKFDPIKALLGKSNISNLASHTKFVEAMDAAHDLAQAYLDHGMHPPKIIGEMQEAIGRMGENFNLGQVINVAEARAAHLQANPKIWAELGKGIEGLVDKGSLGVGGKAIDTAKVLYKLFGGKEGKKALGNEHAIISLLEQHIDRAAANSALQDHGVMGSIQGGLRKWIQESAKKQGIKLPAIVAGLGAAAALTEGEAGAAEMPPPEETDQQKAFAQKLQGLSPEQQKVQLRYAQAFSNINKTTEAKVSAAVTTLFANTSGDADAKPVRSPEYVAVQKRAQELGVSPVVAKFTGNSESPLESFKDKKAKILAAMEDPSKLAEVMSRNLGQLPQHEPEMYMQMVVTVQKTIDYLHQQLPPPVGKSLLDPQGLDPTDEQIADFAGHYEGAVHPLDALDDVAHNSYVDEQLKAVKALWAPTYAKFQAEALGTLQQLGAEGKTMPLDVLQHLDLALELQGAADPMTGWEMANFIHESAAQSGQQTPGGPQAGGSQGQSQPAKPIDPQGKLSKRLTPNSFNLFQEPP